MTSADVFAVNSFKDLYPAMLSNEYWVIKRAKSYHVSSCVQKIYCCKRRTNHLIPQRGVIFRNHANCRLACVVHFSFPSWSPPHRGNIHNGAAFSSPHKHIAQRDEARWERVLCENCFLMLILNFHVYWMSLMFRARKGVSFATLYRLGVCVMILRNLISERKLKLTPTQVMQASF